MHCVHVAFNVAFKGESFPTNRAPKGPLPGVSPLVANEVTVLFKALSAICAHAGRPVGLVPVVTSAVYLGAALCVLPVNLQYQ